MRTKLLLEQFDKNGKLIDKREQFSRSFTLNFIRLLYVQHSQLSHLGLGVSASNLQVCSLPGLSSLFNSQGQMFGIVVGSGAGTPAPSDTKLFTPICHGRLYRAGVPATFLNPSFETGDFTSWTNSGGTIQSGDWALKGRTYYVQMTSTGTKYIEQAVDLTNVTAIIFQASSYIQAGNFILSVKIDGTVVNIITISGAAAFPFQVVDVSGYTGSHTVKFEFSNSIWGGNALLLDDIQTCGSQLEFGGCELTNLQFGTINTHNGEFTVQRYFTNHSGSSISVTEAGMVAYPGHLIAHDTFAVIALANGQLLRVSYIPQITV